MIKHLLSYMLLVMFAINIYGQKQTNVHWTKMRPVVANFSVEAPDQVKAGEQFWIVYHLRTKNMSKVIKPDFSKGDFLIYSSSKPKRKEYNSTEAYYNTKYRYRVSIESPGRVTIPACCIKVGDKLVASDTKTIKVSKGNYEGKIIENM